MVLQVGGEADRAGRARRRVQAVPLRRRAVGPLERVGEARVALKPVFQRDVQHPSALREPGRRVLEPALTHEAHHRHADVGGKHTVVVAGGEALPRGKFLHRDLTAEVRFNVVDAALDVLEIVHAFPSVESIIPGIGRACLSISRIMKTPPAFQHAGGSLLLGERREGRSPLYAQCKSGDLRDGFGFPPKAALARPRLVSLWETKSLRDRSIPMVWNVAPSRGKLTRSGFRPKTPTGVLWKPAPFPSNEKPLCGFSLHATAPSCGFPR